MTITTTDTQTSVEKAFVLLEIMTTRPGPWGVTELTREMGLTKSNVHRLLQALCGLGYVKHWAAEGKYSATLKLWELGARVVESINVRDIAQPHMAALSAQVHETVHLAVLEGHDVVYIDRIESENAIRAHTRIGSRAPANCVATGKAILAYLEHSQLESWRGHLGVATQASIQDFATLEADLHKVRQQGFATTHGEWRQGVFGIAAPIFGVGNTVIGAIGMSFLDIYLTPERCAEFSAAVQQCALATSKDCGYRANNLYNQRI